MAEEEGLNYTIRFIPDVTAIDQAVKELSDRVAKELADAVGKAREEAGGEAGEEKGDAGEAPSGIIQKILEEFKSVKDWIASSLKEVSILGGRARALQHPSSATVGGVSVTLGQKLASGDVSKLSMDQVLQMAAGMAVAGQRIVAAEEMTGLPKEAAVEQVIQDQLGGLKGTIDQMFGLNEFQALKGTQAWMNLAEFWERPMGAAGAARVKQGEQTLMGTIGHETLRSIMIEMMRDEIGGAPDWEAKEMTKMDFAKRIGVPPAEAEALPYKLEKMMDYVRKVGDVIQVGETKTTLETRGGIPQWERDLKHIIAMFEMAQKAGADPLTAQAKIYGGAERGSPLPAVSDIKKEREGEFITDIGVEDVGDMARAVLINNFKARLPVLASEIESFMVDMAPSTARTSADAVLENIRTFLEVLEPHSLPEFWKDIGVDRWIKDSAAAYVNTMKDEIAPRLYQVTKDEVFLGASPDDTESASPEPSSDSERILGKLDTMDHKLDEIKNDLPRSSGTLYGGLIGDMKRRSED